MRTLRTVKIDMPEIIARAGGGPGRLYWHQEYGTFVFQPDYGRGTMVKVEPPPLNGMETKVGIEGSFWAFRGGEDVCWNCKGSGLGEFMEFCNECGGSGRMA